MLLLSGIPVSSILAFPPNARTMLLRCLSRPWLSFFRADTARLIVNCWNLPGRPLAQHRPVGSAYKRSVILSTGTSDLTTCGQEPTGQRLRRFVRELAFAAILL